MFDSLQPHELQHTTLPRLSLSPRVCSNSCPLRWWCYLTISSYATPFSFCPQSFPASGSSPMSWLFTSGGPSIVTSASASVLPTQYSGLISFRIDWLDLLEVNHTLKSLLQHHSSKASILQPLAFFMVQFPHPYTTTGKTTALTRQIFFGSDVSAL